MKLVISKDSDINYLAKIVNIKEFTKHPDPTIQRLKCCQVDGFNIITDIDSIPGLYVYFPVMSQINQQFLSYANLFRNKEQNANPEVKAGYFNDNCKVTIIKMHEVVSEGFIIPIISLQNFVVDNFNISLDVVEETEFDTIEHEGKTLQFVKKFERAGTHGSKNHSTRSKTKSTKKYNKLVEGQFRFHYETTVIRKCPWVINPEDIIHISEKVHGTSFISANVLCKTKLTLIQKIYKYITKDNLYSYDNVYSSRKVVQNLNYNTTKSSGYYGCDVYGEANKIIAPILEKGMTIYAEIIGFTPGGGYVQKNYDYGFVCPKDGNYVYNENFGIKVYRITLTNVDGIVHEFSTQEVQIWCKNHDLVPVNEYYYGKASKLYPEIVSSEDWTKDFIDKLANDKNFHMEEKSPSCKNKVPHEGIVIKIENMKSQAFKLKCFAFLDKKQKDLDKGVDDIEDNQ